METVTQRSPVNKGNVETSVNEANVETIERDLQRISMQLRQRVARDAFYKRQVTRNLAAIHDKIYELEKQIEIRKVIGQFGFDVNMKHGFSAHLEKQIETISSALCVLAPQISWKCVLISGLGGKPMRVMKVTAEILSSGASAPGLDLRRRFYGRACMSG
jgi:hypothetical protein